MHEYHFFFIVYKNLHWKKVKEYTDIQKSSPQKKGTPSTRRDPNYTCLEDNYKKPSKLKSNKKHEMNKRSYFYCIPLNPSKHENEYHI